jgi:hypothetical protein
MFWTTFLAMFLALYVMREIEDYRDARLAHRKYCWKQEAEESFRMNLAHGAGRMDLASKCADQVRYWTKQAKSLNPIYPTKEREYWDIRAAVMDQMQAERDAEADPESDETPATHLAKART